MLAFDDLEFNLQIINDLISGTRIRPSSDMMEPSTFQAISIEYRNFENILLIINPNLETDQIYLARNLGLVAFNRNDTLWLGN